MAFPTNDSWSSVTLIDNVRPPLHPQSIITPVLYLSQFVRFPIQSPLPLVFDWEVKEHNGGVIQFVVEFTFDGNTFFSEATDNIYGTNSPEPFSVLLAITPVTRLIQLPPAIPIVRASIQIEAYHRALRIRYQKIGSEFAPSGGVNLFVRNVGSLSTV